MTKTRIAAGRPAALLVCLAVVVCLALYARGAFAQSAGTAGVLTGNVLDAGDHRPLKDVIVTATSPALQGEQLVITDASGLYRIPDLPTGEYTLTFAGDGFRQLARGNIELRAGSTLRLNVELLPEALTAEPVEVKPVAPTIDVGQSAITTTINGALLQHLPLAPPANKGAANRSFEAAAAMAPGAQADTYGVGIAGTTSPENGYLVDNMSVGNPGFGTIGTPLSSEFMEEINVISGGYMPEYGRTTGGVLSAVTKSGSNDFHGGVFSYYTPGVLQGPVKAVQQSVGSVIGVPDKLSYLGDVGADIGGPILKDKIWFYAGADVSRSVYTPNRAFYSQVVGPASMANPNGIQLGADGNPIVQKIAGSDQQWEASNQTIQALGKLTWAVNDNNKVTLTGIASPSTSGGPRKFAIDPMTGLPETNSNGFPNGTYSSLAHQFNSNAYDLSAKWTSEFANKRVLVETNVGWHHQEDSILPSDGTQIGSGQGLSAVPGVMWNRNTPSFHPVTDFEQFTGSGECTATGPTAGMINPPTGPGLCPVTTYFSGGPYGNAQTQLQVQNYNRYTVGSTLTYLLEGLGHHVIKAGFNVDFTSWNHVKGHAGGVVMSEQAGGVLNDQEQFGTLLGPDNARNIEPFGLTTKSLIAGGFVQDSWSIMDVVTLNVGVRYDVQNMYGGDGRLGLSMPNEWSPRIGVIYDPTQEGHAKIFANYAKYYENVPLGLADGSLTGEPSILSNHDPARCGMPGTPGYCQNDASRKNPGGQPSNAPQLSSQLWHEGGGGPDPVDPGIQPTSSEEIVGGAEYELRCLHARLGISYTRRWLDRWIEDFSQDNETTFLLGNPGYGIGNYLPRAERNYDAVTLYFTRSFNDDWLANASYTISSLRGNLNGLYNASNGEIDVNHNHDFDVPLFEVNANGPLEGDHTHDIKIFAARDWVVDPHNRFSTGLGLHAQSGTPINYFGNDLIHGASYFLLPRGSGGRLPWNYDLDVNVGYRFNLDKDRSILLTVDIFNLLNLEETISVNQQYTPQTAFPGKQGGTLNDVVVSPTNTSNGPFRPLYASDKDPNFLVPNAYQPPRIFRFGIRGTF